MDPEPRSLKAANATAERQADRLAFVVHLLVHPETGHTRAEVPGSMGHSTATASGYLPYASVLPVQLYASRSVVDVGATCRYTGPRLAYQAHGQG